MQLHHKVLSMENTAQPLKNANVQMIGTTIYYRSTLWSKVDLGGSFTKEV